MVFRFLPFLICLIVLAVMDSRASGGFVSPGALPEGRSLWSAGTPGGDGRPVRDEPHSGFWNNVFYLGFLLFAHDSEVSSGAPCQAGTGSFEQPPVPQAGCLRDQRAPCAEIVRWFVRERRILLIHPYVCRLFRPPREHFLSKFSCVTVCNHIDRVFENLYQIDIKGNLL
jgi:hypothetical protein